MKALIVNRYGKGEGTQIGEAPVPEVQRADVLIEIHAASINPLDLKIRDGEVKPILPYRPPFVLGNDLAGVVTQVGADVQKFKVGDEVYARPDQNRIGTFAQFIAVNEADVALKPATLTMEEAASLPLVALTAWQALVERGQARAGQKVLIQGGSGGLGSIAVQLAKHLGLTVATTAGTTNLQWVKELGADTVIDYKRENFADIVRDYDLVLDTQGGKTLEESVGVLKRGGKLISVAGPPDGDFAREAGLGKVLEIAMSLLSYRIRRAAKRHGASYSFLWMQANGEQLRQIAALVDSGALRPVMDQVFPFERVKDALDSVEKGHVRGKIVLKMK